MSTDTEHTNRLTPSEWSLVIGACYGAALGATIVAGTVLNTTIVAVGGILGGWALGRIERP
ncbi:MAG: hypothetical protein HQRvContig03_48 [Haloquadratum phage sp.]|nr:MAG: hypothetical protein HQRvContig03_48 [Haloquadratum phage sp.]